MTDTPQTEQAISDTLVIAAKEGASACVLDHLLDALRATQAAQAKTAEAKRGGRS